MVIMLELEQNESVSEYLSEREGLSLTVEKVPIDCLLMTQQLKQRFPKEYDQAMIKQLAQTINNGIFVPHALVVKEVNDDSQALHLELLQKPAIVFALKLCGQTTA